MVQLWVKFPPFTTLTCGVSYYAIHRSKQKNNNGNNNQKKNKTITSMKTGIRSHLIGYQLVIVKLVSGEVKIHSIH